MARQKPSRDAALAFGAYLRALREARSLSLRDVAEYARARAVESAGRVSPTYLSQLENGSPVAISLPKLLSLAAVCNVSAEAIISQLPEPFLSQRLADLEAWQADGRPMPEPLVGVPQRHERTDAQLDELFAKRARGFIVHWEWKTSAEREARSFLPYAILPPVLEASPGLANDFWKLHPPIDKASIGEAWTAGRLGALAMRPHSPWAGIADTFVLWATRATDAIVAAVRLVAWWNLDFTTSGASCHFTAPEIDARYGFDAVPPGIVIAVRRWQLARFLSEHGAPPAWSPPPAALDGARAFVEYLLWPQPFLPDNAPDEPVSPAVICSSLAALLDSVPRLQNAKTPANLALVEAVASLLNRAADQPASSRSVTRKRSRPAHRPPA